MKVLVTAYCCAPGSGSEQAFGWWWVTSCAREHEVTVITPAGQRDQISAHGPVEGLRFVYVGGSHPVSSSGAGHRFERIRQYLWQLRAIRTVRRVVRRDRPDVAQHLTTGTWRVPSALAFADVPFVIGPLAGSERVPPGLLRMLGVRGSVEERVRLVQMAVARVDPLVRLTLRRAGLILAAGPATFTDLRARQPRKTDVATRAFAHPGIDRHGTVTCDRPEGPPCLSWVGRLVPGKGLDLLLGALTDDRLREVRVDVIGDGPGRARFEQRAAELGLGDRVTFLGQLPQDRSFERIRASDAFVFTSLRELMGQALSEAMQLGAACVVLDWSGPSALVGEDGALKVPVTDVVGTTAALADAIALVVEDDELRRALRARARARIAALIDPAAAARTRDAALARAIAAGR